MWNFAELFVSLTLQCTILLTVTLFMTRWQKNHQTRDLLWSSCHAMILLLCAIGLLLPHLRLWVINGRLTQILTAASGWSALIMVIWSVGALLMTAGITMALIQSSRLVMSSEPVERSLRERIGAVVPAEFTIAVHPDIQTPFCWQFHRPAIVLPEYVLEFPEDELSAILRHEAGHLRFGHPFRLFLKRLVEVIFWFHPLVWAMSRRAALQREIVSDEAAAGNREEATVLLRSLWRIAETQERRGARSLALPAGLAFAERGQMLQIRINELVGRSTSQSAVAGYSPYPPMMLVACGVVCTSLWVPLTPGATPRSWFSPWPENSASLLRVFGISVRDYEIDATLLREQNHGGMPPADEPQ
jgi:bla regulator protein BlaR1